MWPNTLVNILLHTKHLAQNLNPWIFYFPIGVVCIKLKKIKNLQEVKFSKHNCICLLKHPYRHSNPTFFVNIFIFVGWKSLLRERFVNIEQYLCRHIRGGEVYLHSFSTLELDGCEGSTWGPGRFIPGGKKIPASIE